MQAKRSKKLPWIIILIVLISVFIILGTVYLHKYSFFESVDEIITFSIGVLSLIISVVALIVALSTYFSIDSVNKISSMEGNILCNENYNAEYANLIEQYLHCKNKEELEESLFQKLYQDLLKNSNTCMQFTDRIQDILDHILWFAYVNTKADAYKNHTKKLIALLNQRFDNFNAISNGNQYVLREHIKLIMYVLDYQADIQSGRLRSPKGKLLNIRGRMLNNAVSKTVYYNYLGLEYHKKATGLLRRTLNFTGEEFLRENMSAIRDASFSDESIRDELYLYLKKASEAFDQAEKSSAEDILWKGYISFNKARIDLLICILENKFNASWDESIQDAISARLAVLKIFFPDAGESIKNYHSSFLYQEFLKEYYYAKSLHLLVKAHRCGSSPSIIDEAQKMLTALPYTTDAENDIFKRTRTYLTEAQKN